ncbi:hypothetical protein [Nocardia terpenica]|nr:hypothetical protein [Nocardia terpenica]
MLRLGESPSYFRYYNRTMRLEEPIDGNVVGEKLNIRTGSFEPVSLDDVDAVLRPGTGMDFTQLTEDEFVQETEDARRCYLRGDGPIFDIYRQIDEIFSTAKKEGRRINSDESQKLSSLRRQSFRLWEDESARRATGESPSFRYTWVGKT